jgi:hypothetical protein
MLSSSSMRMAVGQEARLSTRRSLNLPRTSAGHKQAQASGRRGAETDRGGAEAEHAGERGLPRSNHQAASRANAALSPCNSGTAD